MALDTTGERLAIFFSWKYIAMMWNPIAMPLVMGNIDTYLQLWLRQSVKSWISFDNGALRTRSILFSPSKMHRFSLRKSKKRSSGRVTIAAFCLGVFCSMLCQLWSACSIVSTRNTHNLSFTKISSALLKGSVWCFRLNTFSFLIVARSFSFFLLFLCNFLLC